MKTINCFFSVLLFLLLAAGFAVMIGFEIHYDVAAGRYGSVSVHEVPGAYWFVICAQATWGSSFMLRAIKVVWPPAEENSPDYPGTNLWAVLDVFIAASIIILSLLGLWAGIDIGRYSYKFAVSLKMPDKAVFGILMLAGLSVFFFLIYQFGVLTFIQDLYPKAQASFRFLQKKKDTFS